MGLVALYGISFGNRRTYQWLTAMMVNFFWNLFVEQPIKVAIVTCVIACIKKRPKWNQVLFSSTAKDKITTFVLRIMLM